MRNPRRSPFSSAIARRPRAHARAGLNVAQLGRRFAKFRREHVVRTRIPDTLRGAVLAAMRQGVTSAQLRRYCGLSSQQLELWQRSRAEVTADADFGNPPARVFDVIGDSPANCGVAAGSRRDQQFQQLELSVDGWVICVRRLDR